MYKYSRKEIFDRFKNSKYKVNRSHIFEDLLAKQDPYSEVMEQVEHDKEDKAVEKKWEKRNRWVNEAIKNSVEHFGQFGDKNFKPIKSPIEDTNKTSLVPEKIDFKIFLSNEGDIFRDKINSIIDYLTLISLDKK